jgi:Rhs element Vgr protein
VRSLKPSLDDEAEGDILYGATLLEFDAEFDARSQSGAVRALAWDPAAQELQEAEAADPAWPGNGNLTADDMTGATDRQEDLLWHGGSMAADALQAWADGALLRARLSASQGRARFQGLSTIRLGSVLQLASLGERFNGKVYITGVRHEFSNNNWVTDAAFGLPRTLHAEQFAISHAPAAGLAAAVSGLQLGVVTQLADDPEGEHRIRVKVPLAGMDEQGVWARVATLDAGAQRGTFFRPEVNDEVVLGFLHDDPAQPVVLGMLHSSATAPPLEATEDNHQKIYRSRSGIALLFDDDKKVVRLQTPGGNRLTLTDADGGIMLEDRNGNKLTMNRDGIVLTSTKALGLKAKTDLKGEGLNTEFTSSASFKAQGKESAALQRWHPDHKRRPGTD